jgi:hypothetical protein
MITPDFDNWTHAETIGELCLTLPGEPAQPEFDDGALASQVWLANEFGDCFGVLAGSPGDPAADLAAALGAALDQLYGTEWGTAEAPTLELARGEAEFVGFGQPYRGFWREHGPGLWLFAIAKPERAVLARTFVAGTTVR